MLPIGIRLFTQPEYNLVSSASPSPQSIASAFRLTASPPSSACALAVVPGLANGRRNSVAQVRWVAENWRLPAVQASESYSTKTTTPALIGSWRDPLTCSERLAIQLGYSDSAATLLNLSPSLDSVEAVWPSPFQGLLRW